MSESQGALTTRLLPGDPLGHSGPWNGYKGRPQSRAAWLHGPVPPLPSCGTLENLFDLCALMFPFVK